METCKVRNRPFRSKNIVSTTGIYNAMMGDIMFQRFVRACVNRHFSCDFGAVDEEDTKANLEALEYGDRISSSYYYGNKEILIITEPADDNGVYQTTTILYPNEY